MVRYSTSMESGVGWHSLDDSSFLLAIAAGSDRGSRNAMNARDERGPGIITPSGSSEVCLSSSGGRNSPPKPRNCRTGLTAPSSLSRCAAVKSIQIFRCDSHGQPELSSTVATTRRLVLSRCCLPGEAAKESTWYIQGRLHKSEQ